jgi:accessory gene regulator B
LESKNAVWENILNWIITGIIALFTGEIIGTFVYMLAFMRLRGALGGFHANSHMKCIVISTVVYVLCLYIINKTPVSIYWILTIAGLAIHMGLVAAIAPVAHPNKPFVNYDEYLKFRKKSLKLSFIYGGIVIALQIGSFPMLKNCS